MGGVQTALVLANYTPAIVRDLELEQRDLERCAGGLCRLPTL